MILALLRFAGIAALALVIVSLFNFYMIVRPAEIDTPLTPALLDLPAEKITVETLDGISISTYLIPQVQDETSAAVIIAHGYPANKRNMLPIAEDLRKHFTVALPDLRSFGESGGSYTTFGAREWMDIEAVTRMLEERGFDQIGVFGFSLGGASALRAAERDQSIDAVASYASFADLHLLGRELYGPRLSILARPLVFLMSRWGEALFGESIEEMAPVRAARALTIPALIIHSKEDNQIPFSHAELLREALAENKDAEFIFLEHGRHGELSENTLEEIAQFFIRTIN